jgi:TPR repeat protein
LTIVTVAVLVSASSAFAGPSEDCAAAAAFYLQHDYTEALRLCRPLAEQGDAKAQSALAFMYTNGEGVQIDHAEAEKWYRKAAEQGNAFGQAYLGFMYQLGKGVSRNKVLAHMWLNLAAAHSPVDFADDYVKGRPEMTKFYADSRDEVAAKMTPDQIAEAQRLAREWKPTK